MDELVIETACSPAHLADDAKSSSANDLADIVHLVHRVDRALPVV